MLKGYGLSRGQNVNKLSHPEIQKPGDGVNRTEMNLCSGAAMRCLVESIKKRRLAEETQGFNRRNTPEAKLTCLHKAT